MPENKYIKYNITAYLKLEVNPLKLKNTHIFEVDSTFSKCKKKIIEKSKNASITRIKKIPNSQSFWLLSLNK